jgi:DNA-binding LytR/AlgR family response regulator
MKVLIVDDEKYSSKKLERTIRKFDRSIQIVASLSSLTGSFDWLKKNHSPDLILVNKNLLRGKTNNLISEFGLEATVTFSLQNDQYSFSAFRTDNLERLKKLEPGEGEKEKFISRRVNTLPPSSKVARAIFPSLEDQFRKRFLVKNGPRYISVETAEIAYFFSFERFVYFKTIKDQKYLVEYSLEELEDMLDPECFFRVNRSVLLAFKSIRHIHPYSGNRLKLQLEPAHEKEVIVSRDKIHLFKDWLGR